MIEVLPTTTADALVAMRHANQQRRAAEVAEVIAIARAAQLYDVTAADCWAGVEKMVAGGLDGTPLIGEFLALEIAGVLEISQSTALKRIADVLNVQHRHPGVWEVFLAGDLWWWQAAAISEACASLDAKAVAAVEARIGHALKIMRFTQVMHHLPGWVVEADPEQARQRHALARSYRGIEIHRISDGSCDVHGRLAPQDAAVFDHALGQLAAEMPEPALPQGVDPSSPHAAKFSHDTRRAAAVGELARRASGQDTLPTHTLVVHIDAHHPADEGQDSAAAVLGGVATVERWGHILTTDLPEFLAGSRVVVRPVIDPNAMPAIDPHDPSDAMRLALSVRNPWDVFPHSTRPARICDADHTAPYMPGRGGQTRLENLGPLSRRAHRAKTHGGWRLTQPQPGTFHWRSPAGFEYLVTPRGTTTLTVPRTGPPDDPPDRPPEPPEYLTADPPLEHPAWDQPPLAETAAWITHQAALVCV